MKWISVKTGHTLKVDLVLVMNRLIIKKVKLSLNTDWKKVLSLLYIKMIKKMIKKLNFENYR